MADTAFFAGPHAVGRLATLYRRDEAGALERVDPPDGQWAAPPLFPSHVEAEPDSLFLQGQGWGFGGSVDLHDREPWTVPGRYGWVGGTGTAGYVIPSSGTVTIWLSQVEMAGPDDFSALGSFLTWAAAR
jgi:CubicO group peptidase (beta-lactamase class C family)